MQVKKAEKKGGKVFSGVSGTGVWKTNKCEKTLSCIRIILTSPINRTSF